MSDLGNYYGSFEAAQEYDKAGDIVMAATEYWMCVQYCEHGDFPYIPDLSLEAKAERKLKKYLPKIPYAPLSKTTFIKGCQCPKALWLYRNKYDQRNVSKEQQQKFDKGHIIGDLAQKLFPAGHDASLFSYPKHIDRALEKLQWKSPIKVPSLPYRLKQNIWLQQTEEAIMKNVQDIYEAAFTYNDVFSAIDILHFDNNHNVAYEVKSSYEIKDVYIHDCALQYYVMSHNIKLHDFVIIYLDKEYVKSLNLEIKDITMDNCDINNLFIKKSILSDVIALQETIEEELTSIKPILSTKKEPQIAMGAHCSQPYECEFSQYCNPHKSSLSWEDDIYWF